MVDFAHVWPSKERDEKFLVGLGMLETLLQAQMVAGTVTEHSRAPGL